MKKKDYFVHTSSVVEEGTEIGRGTKIWHFSHVRKNAKIGDNCKIGQNVYIGEGVIIGNNVKIQNNVSIYEGVTLEDNVFCGPSCVFTNVFNPRSLYPRDRKTDYKKTLVECGSTIGANATIICGVTLGAHSFIGAGAVVTRRVPKYALCYGNPVKIDGEKWMCECGEKLIFREHAEAQCNVCEEKYKKIKPFEVIKLPKIK